VGFNDRYPEFWSRGRRSNETREAYRRAQLARRQLMREAEAGADLLDWLLAQKFVRAELLDAGGLPSMFAGFPGTGPKPNMGMKPPTISR